VTKKMPFDDLDLEFEDEEETKKKKNEAVQVDVDLEFQSPEGGKPRPTQPPKPAVAAGTNPGVQRPPARPGDVRKIEDARAAQAQARPQGSAQAARPASAPQQTAPRVVGSSALKEDNAYDLESQQVVELREQMRRVELESEVKVQVAEFKTEYLTEMLSDMKLAQHQIEQLLVRINAKHPDMKNEVLMIKKILADFTAKKRK
jgi:hypothetical protein